MIDQTATERGLGRDMVIHLYTICWNDEWMLPHFFNHYDGFVDHYFMYDNGSTDNTLSILQSHPKVTVLPFNVTGDSLIGAAQREYNQFWKQSRGVADWVIVCDVDEHLYHPHNLRKYLRSCRSHGITIVQPAGFDMVADHFPDYKQPLCKTVTYGVRDSQWFDKPEIFNPNAILEINFAPGRHHASPIGQVHYPRIQEVLLLHYKYVGIDYVIKRMLEERMRLQHADLASGLDIHWLFDEAKIRYIFEVLKQQSTKVV